MGRSMYLLVSLLGDVTVSAWSHSRVECLYGMGELFFLASVVPHIGSMTCTQMKRHLSAAGWDS